ncbi:MAG: histidinol-phosphate transaminase [Terriglobales bacterium]
MARSRRDFLRSLGFGAAVGATVQWPLADFAAAAEPARVGKSDGFIRLDSNENVYGPTAKVAAAINSATHLVNRYPYPKYEEVTERIAAFHKVKPEQVLFACGSTEILRVAACAFLGPGKQLIEASPTFEAEAEYAKALGSEVVGVPLDRVFAHDLGAMQARVSPSTGLIYICNPNNPTGSITAREDIETFVRRLPATARVVIDEAYHDYATKSALYASFIDRPLDDERVIVTRTFSKVYGLAGLRLGYAVAAPKVIEQMRKFITHDSLNAIVAEVAGIALSDTAGVAEFVRRNVSDRQEFVNSAGVRMLMPIDSQTNFVMMNVQHPAGPVVEHFRMNRILIGRVFPPMDNYIRVSLGTRDDMKAFWQAWDLIPWSKKFMHH